MAAADDGGGDARYSTMPSITTVLVLCQRSRDSTDTVQGILKFIEILHGGSDAIIRYCTPCGPSYPNGDCADYNLELNSQTLPIIQSKMQNERPPIRSFKYVILHTCPFFSMDFEAIWKIMGPDGIMIMTRARDGGSEIAPVPKEVILRPLADRVEVSSRIHMFFDDVDDKPGVYKKRKLEGGNKKGRKNTLRYKPKKSRSYRNRRYHRTRRSGSKKLK